MIEIKKTRIGGKGRVFAFLNGNQVDVLNVNGLTFFKAKKYIKSLYRRGAYEQ